MISELQVHVNTPVYSRFGAICELESAQAIVLQHSHTETAVWRHCLLQKKVDLLTFRSQEKRFKCLKSKLPFRILI